MKFYQIQYIKFVFIFISILIVSSDAYAQTCPTPPNPSGPSAPKGGGGSGGGGSSEDEKEKKKKESDRNPCDDDPYDKDKDKDRDENEDGSAGSNGSQSGDHGSGGFGDEDDFGSGSAFGDAVGWFLNIINAHDPNEIISPPGYDSARFVSVKDNMGYTITYENDPKLATAPAQIVKLYYPISLKQDINSFRLGSFGFNNDVFVIPAGRSFYSTRLDLRDSLGIYVDLVAGIDIVSRQAFWIYESIDPLTGLPPTDPLIGMLPVSDTTTVLSDSVSQKGNGYVNFYIKPISSALTRDTIFAAAKIVFDLNDTIPTNIEFNTIDAVAPSSSVSLLAKSGTTATIQFNGTDDTDGSGVRDYDLFLAQDSANYATYLSSSTDSIITFNGVVGSTYYFFTLATDNTGNRELLKSLPDLTLVFDTTTLSPPVFTLNSDSINALNLSVCVNDSVSECLQVMNSVGGVLTYSVLQSPTGGTVNLSPNVMGVCLTFLPSQILQSIDSLLISVCDTAGGCDSLWVFVSINALPIVTVTPSGPTTFCIGDSVTLDAGLHTSYLWSQGDTTQTITVLSSGTYNVSVSDGFECTSSSLPITVVTNSLPSVSLNSFAGICDTVSTFTLTGGFPAGGIYSGPGVVGGEFVPSITGVGTHIITYVYTNLNGCSDSATSFIIVIPCGCLPPAAPLVLNGPSGVCRNQNNVTFNLDSDPNVTSYNWILPSGITGSSTTNSITVNISGTYNAGSICVNAVNSCGQSSNYCKVISRFTVKPPTPASISGDIYACNGTTKIYTATLSNNATSYNWVVPSGATILSGQGTNIIEVAFGIIPAGSRISVSAVNCIGNSSNRLLNIYGVPALPTVSSTNFPTSNVCGNGTYTYAISPVVGATSYIWEAPAGAIVSDGSNSGNPLPTPSASVQVTLPSGFLSGDMRVNAINACGSGPVRIRAIRSTLATPGTISGPKMAVCGATQQAYTIFPVTGATSYQWTVPSGATIVGASNGTSIQVNFTNSFSVGSICVAAVNSCGAGSQRCLTVQGKPGPSSPIVGPVNVCKSDTSVNYTIAPFPGATGYLWTATNLGLISGGGTSVNLDFHLVNAASINLYVRAQNSCGLSDKPSRNIIVDNCRLENPGDIQQKENTVMLYPNPATGFVKIYYQSTIQTEMVVTFIDITSREVMNSKIYLKEGVNEKEFDISHLSQGMYVVRILMEGEVVEKKLIVH